MIDREIVSRILAWNNGDIQVLVMPDHPTPVTIQTHTNEPVPFVVWGKGIVSNGATRFTEVEAQKTGAFVENGYSMMDKIVLKFRRKTEIIWQ